MINVFKLILEVQDRPLLYDPKYGKSVRNAVAKKKVWKEITKQILDDYSEDLPDDVKDEKVSLVRRKWKSVSDYYKREKKEGDRVGVVRPKKYEFADALAFLDPYIGIIKRSRNKSLRKRTVSTDSNDSIVYLEHDEEVLESEASEHSVKPDSPQDMSFQSRSSQFEIDGNKKRPKRADPLLTAEQSSDNTLVNNEDGDKLFLLSFLSDIKSMTYAQKIEFKIQMLKTLQNIKCGQNAEPGVLSNTEERKRTKRERSSDSSCLINRNDDA